MHPRNSLIIAAVTLASAATTAPAERTLHHEVVINAPIADVWQAFTTAEGFASWAVPKAQIDFRIGGDIRTSYNPDSTLNDEFTIINRILSFEPQRMLSIQNVQAPKGFPNAELFQQTWSVFHFEPLDEHRTRIRSAGLGYGEGPAWDDIYNKFQAGNDYVFAKLQAKFSSAAAPQSAEDDAEIVHKLMRSDDDPATQQSQTILDLLHSLVGGEWIFESTKPDGSIFRARTVFELGPDGQSLTARGWLGNADGMFFHGATQIWREPSGGGAGGGSESKKAGLVRFQSINEAGAITRGHIELEAANALLWHWNATSPDGKLTRYRIRMNFDPAAPDAFAFSVAQLKDDTTEQQLVDIRYQRVERAPPAFLNVRSAS